MSSHRVEDLVSIAGLIDAFPDAVVVMDLERRVVASNRRACVESPSLSQAEGIRCHQALYGRGQPCHGLQCSCPLQRVVESGETVGTVHRFNDSEGCARILQVILSPLRDSKQRMIGLMEVRRDISASFDDEARLRFLTHYDPTTGLMKQRFFSVQMEQWRKRLQVGCSHVALARVRLLAMDRIVESFGSPAVEHLLKVVAERLQAWTVAGAIFGYLGNSDFLIGIPMVDPKKAHETVDHLVQSVLRESFDLGGRDVFLRAAIGVDVMAAQSVDPDAMIRSATRHLMQVIRESLPHTSGGNNGLTAAEERIDVESRLRKAIRHQELRIAYQPQFSLANGHLRGFEALLRWPDEGGAGVAPSEFVPILEETGLLNDISLWVIEKSASMIAALRHDGFWIPKVAVNLSASQFGSESLIRAIAGAVDNHRGLGRGWLELEVTESSLMGHMEQSVAAMLAMKSMGVDIAIDDFGIGYSSLGYLQRLPVQCVKVDRAFVNHIRTSESDHAIVAAIVAMAHGLHLEVIAEGVETPQQQMMLRDLGVDTVQGFLIAKPMFGAEVAGYLERLRNRSRVLASG